MEFLKHNFSRAAFLMMAGVLGLSLSGCSGSANSSDEARAQQTKDAKALEDLFSGVQGKWEGTVSNPSIGLAPFKAEFTLYTYYIQDGTNPDGSIRIRPALRGKFRPVDFVSETDLTSLTGDYDRNGLLRMSGSSTISMGTPTTATGEPLILSVRGNVAGGAMKLEVTRKGGVWGYFDGVRTSADASAPLAGETAEYRERFLRIYGPMEGRYKGRMKATNGNDYTVEISIVIIEQPVSTGGSIPMLMAQYKRSDVPDLPWSLSVDYNAQTEDVVMRENSTIGSTVPGGMTLSVSGKLKTIGGKKTLVVDVRDRKSRLGSVEAVRQLSSKSELMSLKVKIGSVLRALEPDTQPVAQ